MVTTARASHVTVKCENGQTRVECMIDNHRIVVFNKKLMLHIMSGEEIHLTKHVYNLDSRYMRRV